jgi:hypothetical protein
LGILRFRSGGINKDVESYGDGLCVRDSLQAR